MGKSLIPGQGTKAPHTTQCTAPPPKKEKSVAYHRNRENLGNEGKTDCVECSWEEKKDKNREATAEFGKMDVVCDQNTRPALPGMLEMETQLGEAFRENET